MPAPRRPLLALLPLTLFACSPGGAKQSNPLFDSGVVADTDVNGDTADDTSAGDDTGSADSAEDVPPIEIDTGGDAGQDTAIDPDAACAASAVQATPTALPVDILWVVDNSSSMKPAVAEVNAGLNDFANTIGSKGLDYKVILLSLRSKISPITFNGSTRYPVCIPPPLAGDDNCGDGPHFVHDVMDVLSTQPLEQILGTLGQTTGYTPGTTRGANAWRSALRDGATKTIVLVTDDESRLSADNFEHFAGGTNPANANLQLPPGILDPSWNGLFSGYLFSAIYGWGSDTDPSIVCSYPDSSKPPASGRTYSTLVSRTGGVRAKICDGSAAWGPFWSSVATAVVKTSKIACDLAIPTPTTGTLDPGAVNVQVTAAGATTQIPKVADANACGGGPGWYYDSDAAPTKVILCPTSCTGANQVVGAAKGGSLEILFGCKTIIR